ncbi:hypothetical protein TrVE_jg365 [Triparma verrucosa]|uniref:C2CD3 N-terminal C2 domain-containing protein n=1 Tax=Triparma verrucosa TaxID=1606542 RepID=A0A9W6ZA42_9STRA|nr:hypothetical protein TrVE_jg365 [Triparma verrucosa]
MTSECPSLPPLLDAPMLGDVILTVLSVKLLKPPFCDAFVTVQWWGSETTETLHPPPSKSSPNNSHTTLIYPLNGGLPGLKRYLEDMKALPLKLYTTNPITYLGTSHVKISTEGEKPTVQFFDESGELLAEVKFSYKFSLGKYGDHPSNKSPSTLLTGLAGKILASANLENSNVKGVGSFQLNEVIAATDNGNELNSWPDEGKKKAYVPAERGGEFVETGSIGLGVEGKGVHMKAAKHTKSLGRGSTQHAPKGSTPKKPVRSKIIPKETRRNQPPPKNNLRPKSTSKPDQRNLTEAAQAPPQKTVNSETENLARLLNRGHNLSKLMEDNLSGTGGTSLANDFGECDVGGIVGVVPSEIDDGYDDNISPQEVSQILSNVGPTVIDLEHSSLKLDTLDRLRRIKTGKACFFELNNVRCDYSKEVVKLDVEISGEGWSETKILKEDSKGFNPQGKWEVGFERRWPICLKGEGEVERFKEEAVVVEVWGGVVRTRRKGGKVKRERERVKIGEGKVLLKDVLGGDVEGGVGIKNGKGEGVGVGMCRVGIVGGGGEGGGEGRIFSDANTRVEDSPQRMDTSVQREVDNNSMSSPALTPVPSPARPKRPALWLLASVSSLKTPKTFHKPVTLKISSGMSLTPKLTTQISPPGKQWSGEFKYVAGLHIDPHTEDVVSKLKDKKSNVVLEVYEGDDIVGISNVKLGVIANRIILPGTAEKEGPMVVEDGWVEVRCPFGGGKKGEVYLRVGVGLERQVERGFDETLTAGQLQKEDVKESPAKEKSPRKLSEDEWIQVSKEDVVDMPPPVPSVEETPPPPPKQVTAEPDLEEMARNRKNPFVAKSMVVEEGKWKEETGRKSAGDLKEAYLRASFENLNKKTAAPPEITSEARNSAADGTGLIKHTLTLRPLQTCQVPNSGSANPPWGCYIVYTLTWPDTHSGSGGADGWPGPGTGIWWDADSPLLNGTSKHEMYLPTTLPFNNAVCPRGEGVDVELWCKGNDGDTKVGTCKIRAEDFQPGRDGIAKTRNVRLPIEIFNGGGEFRGGDFLPSSLDLEIEVRVEPKIVRVRRERAEAVSKPKSTVARATTHVPQGKPASDMLTVKLGNSVGLRELILLHTNKPGGCVLATFKIYCGADPDARWEAFTTPVVADFETSDFNFETRIPVSVSADWVGYVKSEALVVSLLYVASPEEELKTRGATVMSGVHANVPKNSLKIAEARVMLNGLLLGRDVEGRWKWTVGGESVGGIDGLLSLAGNELSKAKAQAVDEDSVSRFIEPEDKILIARMPEKVKPVKVAVKIDSGSISPDCSSVYAVYQWDFDEGGATEAYGTKNCSVNSTGYVKFNDQHIVWVEEGEEYWKKKMEAVLTVKIYERGTYPEGKITSSPYGCSGKSAADVLVGISEIPLERLKVGEVDGWYHVFNNASGSTFVEEVGQVRVGVKIEGVMRDEELDDGVVGWQLCGEKKEKKAAAFVERVSLSEGGEGGDFVATDYSSVPAPALTSSVEFLDSMPSKSSRIEEMEREVREQGRLDRSLSGVMRSLEEMTVRFLKPEPILSTSRQSAQSVQSLRDESIQSPSRQSVKSLRSSVRSSQDSGLSSSSPLRQLLNASRDLQNSRSASSQPRPSANSPLRVLLRASRASSMASSIGDTFEFPDSDFDEQAYDSDPEIFLRNEGKSDSSYKGPSTNSSLSTTWSTSGTPDRIYIKNKKEKERRQKISYLTKSYDYDLGREKDYDTNLRASIDVIGESDRLTRRVRRNKIDVKVKEDKALAMKKLQQDEIKRKNKIEEDKVKRRQEVREYRRKNNEKIKLKKRVDVKNLNVSPGVKNFGGEGGEKMKEEYRFNKERWGVVDQGREKFIERGEREEDRIARIMGFNDGED